MEFLEVIDYKMRIFQMVLFLLQIIVSMLLLKQIHLSYGRLGRPFSLIKCFTANQHIVLFLLFHCVDFFVVSERWYILLNCANVQ